MQDGCRIFGNGKSSKTTNKNQHHKFPSGLGYPKPEGRDEGESYTLFRTLPSGLRGVTSFHSRFPSIPSRFASGHSSFASGHSSFASGHSRFTAGRSPLSVRCAGCGTKTPVFSSKAANFLCIVPNFCLKGEKAAAQVSRAETKQGCRLLKPSIRLVLPTEKYTFAYEGELYPYGTTHPTPFPAVDSCALSRKSRHYIFLHVTNDHSRPCTPRILGLRMRVLETSTQHLRLQQRHPRQRRVLRPGGSAI